MQDDPFHSQIEEEDAARRARAKQRASSAKLALTAIAIAVTAVVGVLAVVFVQLYLEDSSRPAAPPPRAVAADIATPPATDRSSADAGRVVAEEVVDDPTGRLLWASPTAGPPLSLAYVPAGTQCLVHLRPAMFASHPERKKVMAALGPWGLATAEGLRALAATSLADMQSVLISIVPTDDGGLDASMRIALAKPWGMADLASRLEGGQSTRHGSHEYLVVGDRAYLLLPARPGAADIAGGELVVCPANMAAELLESAGEVPPLGRDLERLVQWSDSDRMATILLAPKFLQASGSHLLTDAAAPLRDALAWLVGADVTAIALSLHWDENFFVELRATPTLNVPARRLAGTLRERIGQSPDAVEEIVLNSPWHPHGRKLLARLPGMLRKLAGYTRSGEEEKLAVLRCYLPPMAGHNLLMGAELLLTQPRQVSPEAMASTSAAPSTLEADGLNKVTSLSFAKESLERALELLAEDVGMPIVVQGADLQLDGITKNQSLELDLRDRPAREILLEILLRANPDRTATGPADPRQKLVYVAEPGQGDAQGRIIVTTRTAAERRGDALPDVFVGGKR